MSELAIFRGKGFVLEFNNRWTISVQFSDIHYCDNRMKDKPVERDYYRCINAEVAIIFGGEFIDLNGDSVRGWISPDNVAKLIALTQSLPEDIIESQAILSDWINNNPDVFNRS